MLKFSQFKLRLAVFLFCISACGSVLAGAQFDTDAIATRMEVATSAGQNIPSGAFGFVLISRPREVNLLQLRGIAGRGQAILRTNQPGICITLPIRFVAGDFGGDSITGHLSKPIHFIIKSREVARALAKGQDIVSDTYNVGGQMDPNVDIVLQSGLDGSFGFVVNPGRNILGDLFGVNIRRISCQRI